MNNTCGILKKVLAGTVLAALVCTAGVLPQTASAETEPAAEEAASSADPAEVLPVLEEMLDEPEEARIIVDGEVTDADAALSVCTNGLTVLQYDTQAEAKAAQASFEADGYDAVQDEVLPVTFTDTSSDTFSTYEAQAMNLECNAEGEEDVLVAIIDTGANVQYLDTDQFVTGYNAADGSSDITDYAGHGTMTASIVSAYTGSNVSIMPVKLMDSEESGVTYATLFAAFEYVLEQEPDVVSMSLGLEVDSRDRNWRMTMQEYEQNIGPYVDALTDAGITMVVAAGNSYVSTDYVFPAGYGDCWTISSIGVSDDSYELSYFSNYGDIDFCAPGEDVTVTDMDGTVGTNDGTSFSAPLIASVAAQLAGNGLSTNTERYEYLQTICLDLGTSGYDSYYGYGLPQMEHNYQIETTTATCQTEGDTTYICACGETYSVEGETIDHIAGDPVITDTDDGGQVWSYYCTMCGELLKEVTYTAEDLASDTEDSKDSDGQSGSGSSGSGSSGSGSSGSGSSGSSSSGYTVPSTAASASKISLTGATVSQVTQTMAKVSNDGDFADSSYWLLQAKVSKVTKTSLTVKFQKVAGAKSYVIYGAKCGKSNKYKKLKKLTGTSATFKKIAGKKVKKGTYYKFVVVALDANGKVIQTSKTVHAVTNGGSKTNAMSISILKGSTKVSQLSLSAGSSVKIKTKTTKQVKSKKIANHRKVKYESTNTNIATVNANGKIKAKKKGSCYIYVYAQNGKSSKVLITVE